MTVWTGTVIDANTDTEMAVETAEEWTRNFKNANETAVLGHSFGIKIFMEIEKHPGFEIVPAIDDSGKPQLLLIMHRDPAG